jgi:uncharacterized protein (DUF1697 family)
VSSVVFLRAINVGGANLCKPAQIAKELKEFEIVNIGAVGTFVVRANVSESTLREKIALQLAKPYGIKCEIMICSARDVLKLAAKDPFAHQPGGTDITRFVSVLAKPLHSPPALPLSFPSKDEWLIKLFAIQGRFALGVYRRQPKAVSYLGRIEKLLGVPITTRNWNTILKIVATIKKT